MSIINDFLEKITGLDLDGSDSGKKTVERPCSNCPSNCAIAGTACSVCEPYKKKLIDAVYHVDHIDDYYDQYEVVSKPQASSGGTVHCTHCGAGSANPYICEYCGSQLSEAPVSSGKIQVSAASEIPNPIMEAQDIIWERYDAVVGKSSAGNTSSGSFLTDLFSQLIGTDYSDDKNNSVLGAKMSEAEIKEAASLYHVTTGEYLTGLDNGKYLTLSGKKEADRQVSAAGSSFTPASMGMAGMAAIGMFADSIFNRSGNRRRPHDPQRQQPSRPVYRDTPVRPGQSQSSQRISSDRQEPQRPQRPERRPEPGHDVLERPASQPTHRDSSERRRPSAENRMENKVMPQKSKPSARSGGPSHERHPENRRGK